MEISGIHLKRLHMRLEDIVYELTRMQFSRFSLRLTWVPSINVYRCEDRLVVCADLAGVDKEAIELTVETQRLIIRGRRDAPEPKDNMCKTLQVLAMEVDYGVFEREVRFSADVATERVTAEQENGLLWIHLPFRPMT